MIFENSKHDCLRIQGNTKPLNGKEILIQTSFITVKYDYPLGFSVIKKYKSQNGFTRNRLVRLIRQAYMDFYSKPAQYGIWGHGKGDLVIENLRHVGRGHYVLDIGS
jgi:hypothetical protein